MVLTAVRRKHVFRKEAPPPVTLSRGTIVLAGRTLIALNSLFEKGNDFRVGDDEFRLYGATCSSQGTIMFT